MRFSCEFQNPKTGELTTVLAQLSDLEVKSVDRLRSGSNADVYAQACALRAAYRDAPKGYYHTKPPVEVQAA